MQTLQNKVVMITGAAGGLGSELARQCLLQGAMCSLVDNRSRQLKELTEQLSNSSEIGSARISSLVADVADWHQIQNATVATKLAFGRLDVVIAAAGVLYFHDTPRIDIQELQNTIQTNLLGPLYTIEAARRATQDQVSSRAFSLTIAVVSSLTSINAPPQMVDYAASKRGLDAAIDALRIQWADRPIHLLLVSPGFIDTDLVKSIERKPFCVSPEYAAKRILAAIIGRRETLVFPFSTHVLMKWTQWLPRRVAKLISQRYFDKPS